MKTLWGFLAAASLLALAAEKPGDAGKGKALFEKHCATCHHAASTEKKLGPGLKGLFQKRKLQSTGQKPTDQAVRSRLEKGGGGMPSFKELLSADEKADVLAYLKTL